MDQISLLLIHFLFIALPFSRGPEVHKVEIKGMKFAPSTLTVRNGDTIVWINNDIVVHDVTEMSKEKWKAGPIPVGKTWKIAIHRSTSYFCSIHPMMKGEIVVK